MNEKLMSFQEYKNKVLEATKQIEFTGSDLSDGAFDSIQMDLQDELRRKGYPTEFASLFEIKFVPNLDNLKEDYEFYVKLYYLRKKRLEKEKQEKNN